MRSIWLESCSVPKLFILLVCVVCALAFILLYRMCVCVCVRVMGKVGQVPQMHTDVSAQVWNWIASSIFAQIPGIKLKGSFPFLFF